MKNNLLKERATEGTTGYTCSVIGSHINAFAICSDFPVAHQTLAAEANLDKASDMLKLQFTYLISDLVAHGFREDV